VNTPNELYTLLLTLTALISLWRAVAVWRRDQPITWPVSIFLLGMAWWGFTYALHWSRVARPYPAFWLELTYVGAVTVPSAFFAFTLRYTGRNHWLVPRVLLLSPIEPLLTLFFLWTDSYHGLFYGKNPLAGATLFNGGLWFWVNIVYSYGLVLVSVYFLVEAYRQSPHIYKGQARVILAGALLPWAVNTLSLAGIEFLPGLDTTPLAFTLTGFAFAYGTRHYRLLDILPVARNTLIESMADGVLVLDSQNRLVDINPAGLRMLQFSGVPPIGRSAVHLFSPWPALTEHFREVKEGHFQVEIDGNPPRFIDLLIAPLHHHKQQSTERLLVLRDITRLKRTEIALREANGKLQEQVIRIETLQAKLQEQATRDPLTVLFNRRYLGERLEEEVSLAEERGQTLCLLILDIDNFKQFNDTHGHGAGDVLLQSLAEILQSGIRADDIACRYGGEEFVVVLPGAEIPEATRRGEDLRLALEQMTVVYQGALLRTTLSVGLAAYPLHAGNVADLLRKADEALYRAKGGGRNRVVVYQGNESGTYPRSQSPG